MSLVLRRPTISGSTSPTALAAPVVVGIIEAVLVVGQAPQHQFVDGLVDAAGKIHGARFRLLADTGAYRVVARALDRDLEVFVPTWADPPVVDRLRDLEATIRVCERREGEVGDPCYLRFREAVSEGALPFTCQGTENALTIDGGNERTI